MNALKFIWDADEIPLEVNSKLSKAMPLNLLLWGGENWNRNAMSINKCEVFHHKVIRRMLKTPMSKVKEDRIKMN